ncbi:MAG: hypothetical protein RLZZ301_1693 [Bacteroidota bacterium]|jgi:UDP-N-acetylmuramoyl-L-alanyl-D-glutamate--2,6-diaminopimelate ligase
MQLNALIQHLSIQQHSGSLEREIEAIVFDSRQATANTLFVAIAGTQVDGHDYIATAHTQGCRVFVVEKTIEALPEACVIQVSSTAEALADLAGAFYGHPSKELTLVGVTGTNGKTTTATLLHRLFLQLGHKSGLLSTVVNKIGDVAIPSTHTTPDPIQLNALLRRMVNEGCSHCFMEVSSHAIHQHRIRGLEFAAAGFTNISHDHLDYHKTFAEYIRVKKAFFDGLPASAVALVNSDDRNGMVMLQNTAARKCTFALKTPADYKGKIVENAISGLVLSINQIEVCTRLVGAFNAYNLLLVYGIAIELGQDQLEVLRLVSNLETVEGRFQYVRSTIGITAIVDYAHTPDALENVLDTIAAFRKEGQQVITVVGCGGDRDRDKRPKMAAIAAAKSTQVVLTSDNPRSEDPLEILAEMEAGLSVQDQLRCLTISDRAQAIKTAIVMARAADIILIAGKGHEKYQEIQGVKHDFDDLELTKNLFLTLQK